MKKVISLLSLAIVLISAQAAPSLPQGPCSSLTQEEQLFASKLSRIEDQKFFCQSMTAAERQKVIDMTRPLTPDQAMQQYQQGKSMMPAPGGSTAPSQPPKSGGGCPIN